MLGRLTRRVIAPGAYDANAKVAAQSIRHVMGDMYLRELATRHAFKEMQDALGNASADTKRTFAIAADTGNYAGLSPDMQRYAMRMKELTDQATRRLQMLGVLEDAKEFYLGRIWKPRGERAGTPEGERTVLNALAAKAPITGPKTFLKERFYDHYEDAINSGLEPVFENPITAHLAKLSEMNKFYAGTLLTRSIKENGYAHFYKMGEPHPEGFMQMEGREFQRAAMVIKNKDGTTTNIPAGAWFAPEGFARVMNNFVSKGLEATPFREASRAYRKVGNALNMMQLSFSAFHPIATTIEAQISRLGIGIDQAWRGEFGKAAHNIVGGLSPTNWYTNVKEGDSVIKAVLDPAHAPPEMQRIVQALGAAGGRVWMNRFDRATDEGYIKLWKKGALGQAMREAANKYPDSRVTQAFNVAGRALETTMAPIMEYLVPRQKMGVFSRMAKDWIDSHPDVSNVEFAAKMQDIWDSVDNRLGEMAYDNLFWHKMMKDAAFLTVRSVGWNMGTLREIGGGMYEGTKQGLRLATGRDAEWTHRMSYLIALPIVTGMYGAMYQYLSTGKGPEEPKDCFFPKYLLKDGAKERVSIPSYMRDVYAWSIQPWQTAQNKLHPMTSMVAQAAQGRDYYGDIIANHDDPVVKQVEDVMMWAGKSVLPFSFSGEDKMRGHPVAQRAAAAAGIQPTPGYIADPQAQERWMERQHRQDVRKKSKHDYARANPPPVREDAEDEDEE